MEKIQNKKSYLEKKKENIAVFDFFTNWCAPCKAMKPVLDGLSSKYKDVGFYEIDAEDQDQIVAEEKVTIVPTIIIYKNGELFKKHVGPRSREILSADIDEAKNESKR